MDQIYEVLLRVWISVDKSLGVRSSETMTRRRAKMHSCQVEKSWGKGRERKNVESLIVASSFILQLDSGAVAGSGVRSSYYICPN